MNVILYGMMGVGKTSVGRALSLLTGKNFVDTDALIEEKYGGINDIFEKYGEEYFRNLEAETARAFWGKDGLIISVGGGFVLKDKNVTELKKNGKFVYLRASLETLVSRLKTDETRPLLKGGALLEKIKTLMETRDEIYENCADISVFTDGKTLDEIAAEILEKLGEKSKRKGAGTR